MKKAVIFAVRSQEHQVKWGNAFAAGLRRHGWEAQVTDNLNANGDLMAVWSTRFQNIIQRARQRKAEMVVFERGYVGNRFEWTSISFGGALNNRATFYGPFHDPSRWEQYFAEYMKPWRINENGYALILCQIAQDMALKGLNPERFYSAVERVYAKAGLKTKRRRHPNVIPRRDGQIKMDQAARSLQADLAGARLAITWNSNSGTEAVLAGVPTVTMDEGAMAWPVSGHALELPPTPDRMAWAHALAWKQWRYEELSEGHCWDVIKPCAMAA